MHTIAAGRTADSSNICGCSHGTYVGDTRGHLCHCCLSGHRRGWTAGVFGILRWHGASFRHQRRISLGISSHGGTLRHPLQREKMASTPLFLLCSGNFSMPFLWRCAVFPCDKIDPMAGIPGFFRTLYFKGYSFLYRRCRAFLFIKESPPLSMTRCAEKCTKERCGFCAFCSFPKSA